MRRLQQISVTNLFGMFTYHIPLNLHERITIIHGPNGFGKTVILRMLNELFHKDSTALRAIPFSEFRVDFDDGASFWVTKSFETASSSNDEEEKPSSLQTTFH